LFGQVFFDKYKNLTSEEKQTSCNSLVKLGESKYVVHWRSQPDYQMEVNDLFDFLFFNQKQVYSKNRSELPLPIRNYHALSLLFASKEANIKSREGFKNRLNNIHPTYLCYFFDSLVAHILQNFPYNSIEFNYIVSILHEEIIKNKDSLKEEYGSFLKEKGTEKYRAILKTEYDEFKVVINRSCNKNEIIQPLKEFAELKVSEIDTDATLNKKSSPEFVEQEHKHEEAKAEDLDDSESENETMEEMIKNMKPNLPVSKEKAKTEEMEVGELLDPLNIEIEAKSTLEAEKIAETLRPSEYIASSLVMNKTGEGFVQYKLNQAIIAIKSWSKGKDDFNTKLNNSFGDIVGNLIFEAFNKQNEGKELEDTIKAIIKPETIPTQSSSELAIVDNIPITAEPLQKKLKKTK
jgi:hypothetical protein